jgi:thymidylate kinase
MEESKSLERARQRLAAAGNIEAEDRFEAESMDFFRKVRKGFLEYADMHDYGDIALLPATGDENEVTERIKALLLEKFGVSL